MANKKVFVSLPMRGRSNEEIKQKMLEMHSYVKDEYDLISTLLDTDDSKKNNLWYLGRSIQLLGEADLVIFTQGWMDAPGCVVEMTACSQYSIPYTFERFVKKYGMDFTKYVNV